MDGSWSFLNLSFRLPVNDATYVPMPYFLSTSGYGLLVDTTNLVRFDVASTDPNQVELF